jgi:hypothetical protein
MKEFNPTMALMQLFKVPLTRENYRMIDHVGAPPSEVHPEEEAAMPKRFRLPIIHSNMMPEPYMTEAQKQAEKAKAMGPDITIGGNARQLKSKSQVTPTLDTENPPLANGYVTPNAGVYKGGVEMNTSNPEPQEWETKQPRLQ